MRRWVIPLAAVLALAAAQPASAQAVDRCAVEGSKQVRLTQKVRVYWWHDKLWGCIRETGVKRELYRNVRFVPNEYYSVHHLRVAGYHVALVVSSICTVCGDGGPFAAIREVELRSNQRRNLRKVRERPPNRGTAVDALALDRCGRIAYRATLAGDASDPDPELHVWVGYIRRRLDRGNIERKSIRLEPGAVRWVRDGKPRSAPLSPAC